MDNKITLHRIILCLFIALSTQVNSIIGKKTQYVTYGSVFKLQNTDYVVRLHSHDIKYGTGSGQQSVTGTESQEDNNSHWLIKAPTGKSFVRGTPVKCGDTVRLEHSVTQKNLHSHDVSSPLSHKQEVSCYGDESGDGDSGDHWIVECDSDYWERSESIKFKHVDTHMYLGCTGRTFGNPIVGQREIVGDHYSGHTQWKAMEGMFIHPPEVDSYSHQHTEL